MACRAVSWPKRVGLGAGTRGEFDTSTKACSTACDSFPSMAPLQF